MVLANRPQASDKPRWISKAITRLLRLEFAVFLLLTAALIGLTLNLMAHGYVSGPALTQYTWQQMAATAHDPGQYFVLVYPPLPTSLGILLSWLPGVTPTFAPYLLQIICSALLLVSAWRDIAREHGYALAFLMVILVMIQPVFLWLATSGYLALEVLVLYGLCRSLQRLKDEPDVHTLLLIGAVMFLMFLTNMHAGLFLLVLFPTLIWIRPRRIIEHSSFAFHLICFIPVALLIVSWCYLNWLYTGDPIAPFRLSTSLLQEIRYSASLPHASLAADHWYHPLRVIMGGLLACSALLLLPTIPTNEPRRAPVVILIVIIGTVLLDGWLHGVNLALEFIAMLFAPLLAALRRMRPKAVVVLLLVVSLPGGWWVIERQSSSVVIAEWRDALRGRSVTMFADEHALCHWLSEHPRATLVDDLHAYPIVAECGQSAGLITPADARFNALTTPALSAERILVIDPAATSSRQDRLTRLYPTLWQTGHTGYHLVYEQGSYRLWERDSAGLDSAASSLP